MADATRPAAPAQYAYGRWPLMTLARELDSALVATISPPGAEPLISVRQVGKTYSSGVIALDGITFDVEPGQFVSLVGPSGCGKSTLLRIIAGLGAISQGSVLVEGLPPHESRKQRADTAFVFQDATLMPWRDVLGNVELPLELRGVQRTERRQTAQRALETVRLTNFATAYPRELSGGMRMRVSLARALAAGPRLLLMDEPFGALDEITRQRLNGELLTLCALANWTVVFVTHNVFEAVFLSSRILVMSRQPGRIVAEIDVDLPYPRTTAIRTAPEYTRVVGQVIGCLEDA
jgi:NitT/TauT family transport system ATP-binding protein